MGSICLVVQNFLGIEGAVNYAELVEKILRAYELLGARMSLMWHFYTFHPIWAMSAMSMGKGSIRI